MRTPWPPEEEGKEVIPEREVFDSTFRLSCMCRCLGRCCQWTDVTVWQRCCLHVLVMWLGEEQPEVSRTPVISSVKFQCFDRQRLLLLRSVASLLYQLIVRVAYYHSDLSFLTNNINSEEKLPDAHEHVQYCFRTWTNPPPIPLLWTSVQSYCHLWVVFKHIFPGVWHSVYMPVSVPVCTCVGVCLDWGRSGESEILREWKVSDIWCRGLEI